MSKDNERLKSSTHTIDDSQIHVSVDLDRFREPPENAEPDNEVLLAEIIEAAAVPEDKRLGVKEIIAKGGVAAVWLTKDCALSRQVALKLMHKES